MPKESASNGSEYESYPDYAERQADEQKREANWLDAISLSKLLLLWWATRVGTFLGVIIAASLALIILAIAFTYMIHLFIPLWGWLTPAQETRIISGWASWYTSATPALFPVLILTNSWLIWLASRKRSIKKEHDN